MSTKNKDSGRKVYRKRIVRKSKSHNQTNNPSNQIPAWKFYGITAFVVMFVIGLFGFGTFIADLNSARNNKTSGKLSAKSPNQQVSKESQTLISDTPRNNVDETLSSQPIESIQNSSINSNINSELVYNSSNPEQFQNSPNLTKTVDNIVKYVKSKKLPLDKLSITLIDINSKTIAGYKQNTPRYPASVVKMFWMVALYAKVEKQLLKLDSNINHHLKLMIVKSDNNSSGRILDLLTNTESSQNKLNQKDFEEWKNKRDQINLFFQKAGYQGININQKTFPLLNENIPEPIGPDLQIRSSNTQNPIRNKITTRDAARLMYEISSNQAAKNPDISEEMFNLLTRDTKEWKAKLPNPIEFNPVESFFGEALPYKNTYIASKAGITSSTRMEVAFITTKDRKTKYVLAVSGDDPAYAKNKSIFPGISELVYKQMTGSNKVKQ